jgi:hypothetical protein
MAEYRNCTPLINALGDKIAELPILDIGNWVGHSGYIDFIEVKDMSHPIMKGRDCVGRPFIALKFKVTPHNTTIQPSEAVGTFFQRYTDNNRDWAYGTCFSYGKCSLYNDARIRRESEEYLTERLQKLVNGEEIPDAHYYEPFGTISMDKPEAEYALVDTSLTIANENTVSVITI